MNTLTRLAALIALLPITHSFATPVSTTRTLDHVVVTATGMESSVRDVQASVEVLDRPTLERYGSTSLPAALRHATGLQVSNSGANGDASIRGFNRNHTLVLIDGFRRTNNYGTNNLAQISLFDAERVEIVRGPLSSLYGSDALGGVINVISRHPGDEPVTRVESTIGSARDGRETLHTAAHLAGGDARIGHSLTLDRLERGRLRHPDATSDDFGRLTTLAARYRGAWRGSEGANLNWTLEAFDRNDRTRASNGDTRFTRHEDERRYFGSLDYSRPVHAGELRLRAGYGHSEGETTRNYPELETTDFGQFQSDAVYQFSPHDAHFVSVGAGTQRDRLDVSINSRTATRSNHFVLIQDQWEISPAWQLVAGLRMDRFDDFGSTTNPRLSLGWQDGSWSARLGYGTAFRAPSLLEQYASFVRGGRSLIRGNPDLDPETARTWEFMLRREFARGHIEATVHRNDLRDLIDSEVTGERIGGLGVIEYRNLDRARIDGLELDAAWAFTRHWTLTGGADFLNARDALSGARLTGRARQVWRVEGSYAREAWQFSLRARHMRDYLAVGIDAPRGSAPYDTHLTRVDATVRYLARPGVELFGGIDNLFDRRDPDNFTVTSTGTQRNDPDARYAYVGLRLDF